jgi:hypothetical protein
MSAQRLEEVRALLSSLYWEAANRTWEQEDMKDTTELLVTLNKAGYLCSKLKNREAKR